MLASMGTWAEGTLDNDTALDGLAELTHGIVADLQQLAGMTPDATSTARLGAAVGLLQQLSPFDFSRDSGHCSPHLPRPHT